MPPQIDTDGVSHGDDVDPGAVRDARDLVVPGDDPHALSPVALHLQERRYRDLGLHHSSLPSDIVREFQNFSTHGRSSISHAHALRG